MKDFTKGIFFITAFLPVVEGTVSIFNQLSEYVCAKIAFKTYEIQRQVKQMELEDNQEESCTNVVGFQIPNTIDEDEDE